MKKVILKFVLISFLFVTGVSLLAFNSLEDIKENYAAVNKQNGLYIFSDCMPVKSYTYLGEVKSNTGGLGSAQYDKVKARLIKKAQKKYPQAEGIILKLKSGSTDRAEVIKFD